MSCQYFPGVFFSISKESPSINLCGELIVCGLVILERFISSYWILCVLASSTMSARILMYLFSIEASLLPNQKNNFVSLVSLTARKHYLTMLERTQLLVLQVEPQFRVKQSGPPSGIVVIVDCVQGRIWFLKIQLVFGPSSAISASRCRNSGSVAEALSWYFSILVNKICKIMKIFGQVDHVRNWWVSCQY